jgi:hypothetical protein
MTSFVYGNAARAMLIGGEAVNPIDWLNNAQQVGLSDSTHVPTKDDEFLSEGGADDFVDGELVGTGYSRFTLAAGKTLTYDAANDRVELDAEDAVYTGIDAGTAAQATILQNVGGVDTARRLVANVDSGGFPVITNGGDVTLQWSAQGILHLTV